MIKKDRFINYTPLEHVFSVSKPYFVTVLVEKTVCMQHVNCYFSNFHYGMPLMISVFH